MKRSISIICSLVMVLQLLLGTVTVWAEGETEAEKYTAPDSPAVTYNMNVDWKFRKATSDALALVEASEAIKDSDGKQFYEVGYNDDDWETVSVPHPINAVDSFDGTIANSGEGGIYRGFMFYRKHITVPETDSGKKFFIEFEAVRNSIYLYVNGQMAGYYEAGVVSTGYDITDYIIPGQDNVIAVATDNAASRGRTNFTTTETINDGTHTPGDLSGAGYEWNTNEFNETQGGITGNVNLYAKSQIYQTLPLYNNLKTTGNYIYASDFDLRDVNNSKATINVKAEIRNETDSDKDLTLQVDVVKMDGTLAGSFTADGKAVKAEDKDAHFQSVVPADAYEEEPAATNADTVDVSYITASASMENLRLWSPEDPYIYTVYTILKDGDDIIDVQEKATGFREVIYDYNGTDGGFKINGRPIYLKGYAQRSTNEWAAIGVANDWLTDYDMSLVRESNSNFIRWMHVAPKPAAIRSTDKYGVVSVCPAGDKEKDVEGRQWDQRMEAMRDAIIYYRNSPSVIFWEAGNGDITAEHMQEMTNIKQLLDPNGYRFMGCRTISSVEQVKAAEYIGTMLFRNAGPAQNSMKTLGKYIPIMETEYSRGESPRRVWDDFSPYFAPGYKGETLYDYVNKYTTGSEGASTEGLDTWDLTQEDFVIRNIGDYTGFYNGRVNGGAGSSYTDSSGNVYNVNQYVASALMIWADSNQHGRMTVSENCRTSGKVDAARIKKEAFYAMQAAQSDEPAVHIVGHWNYPAKTDDNYWYYEKKDNGAGYYENGEKKQRDPSAKTVYVIGSNDVSKVELYINGVLSDTCTKPSSNYIYSFPNTDVTQSGTVTAKAYNARDEVIAEDEIKTAGDPLKIRLTPVTGPKGFLADGSDIMYFDVEVVDSEGNVCPLSYDKINLKLSGEGTLMGGYNSGANANTYTQEREQSIYAECGINRVFVRSTRNAGAITLSASIEGQSPSEATVNSTEVEITGGLAEYKQQSLAANEKPPVIQQTVPAMKSLANVFTADFEENGNTEVVKEQEEQKDIYEVKVNGSTVEFTDKAYKAGGAIWMEAVPVIEALKTAGAPITYSYDENTKTLTVNGDGIKIESVVDDPDIFVTKNGVTDRVGPMNGAPLISGNGIFVMDISTMLGQLGIAASADSENKIYSITYTAPTVSSLSANNIVEMLDAAENDENTCVEITATYDDNGVLTNVETKAVNISEIFPVSEKNKKVMYWNSLSGMKPLSVSEPVATPVPYEPQDITPYDTQVALHTCEETAISTALTIEDGAPDGTKYIKTGDAGNNKYGEYCFESECAFEANTKADVMLAADVRFDTEGAGITPEDAGDKKVAGAIVSRNGTIQMQRGGSDYTNTNISIDTSSWYHIALVGRYSASDANVDMYVWKYNADGTKTFIQKVAGTPLRNLSASKENGVSHLNVLSNTSVDNIALYKLGADTLALDSADSSIKAGETMLFTYSATRANEYITAPAVVWSVYNEANDAPLDGGEISVSDGGLLTIGGNAKSQIINVRATANAGTDNEIYASKKIKVNAVDVSSDTYDALTITADKAAVRVGSNVQITAAATKNGAAVTPGEGDLRYLICNEANLRELGNKGIKITADGVLSVTADVIPQTITVRGTNKSGSVTATCQVEVLPANMNTGNEDTYTDTFASANACEEYGIASLSVKEGSWDGSGYYDVTAAYDFEGFESDTSADVIYSADMRFAKDGAGWTVFNKDKGKLGLQLSSSGTTLNAIGASNKVVGSLAIDKSAWYNVQVMCSTGNTNAYAVCMVYKYDENGNKVHPQTGAQGTPYLLTVSLRNLAESTANHINISAGTEVDNVLNMYVAPDKLKISVDTKEVLAGGNAQASATASRKGIDFPYLNANLVKYEIYDAENKYPLGDDKITIDASGKISVDAMANPQDVYVRVLSTSGGLSDSAKLTIKSSDIFEIMTAGFNAEYTVLKRLRVNKNFYYDNDVTFVAATYDENGAMTSVGTKKVYGDALTLGDENYVQMNTSLPSDFNKVNDRFNAFIVTKLSSDSETEIDTGITVQNRPTDSNQAVYVLNTPNFDAGSKVVVLALKNGADETNVRDSDIMYFTQMNASEITNNTLVIPAVYEDGMTVKLTGNINGVHAVKKAVAQNN